MSIIFQINSLFTLKRKIGLFLSLILIPVIILEIWSLNRLSTYGEQISSLENTKSALKLENQILQNEIARKSSLRLMESASKLYGFKNVSKIEYLKSSDSLAFEK